MTGRTRLSARGTPTCCSGGLRSLFVNQATLLPVLVPMAPATTVVDRFPAALTTVLQALGVDRRFTEPEIARMAEHRLAKTASRTVLGTMNEFVFMGRAQPPSPRTRGSVVPHPLAGPDDLRALDKREGSPDRELAAFVARHGA